MAKKTEKPAPPPPAPPAAAPRGRSAAAPTPSTAPAAKPGPVAPLADDPAMATFGQALAAVERKEWEAAIRLFDQVLAESDRSDLSARARQYRAIAEARRTASAPGKAQGEVDPFLAALVAKNRGDLDTALEACRKDGRDQKEDRFAYLAAAIHGLQGRLDEALEALHRAIELNPKNRIHAFHDADFAELRKNRDYRSVFGLP